MLNTVATTFNEGVAPCHSRRRHNDGDLTVRLRTQDMYGNGVPVHRVAARELAREDTEEREYYSSARLQEQQWRGLHVKRAPGQVDEYLGARATPMPPDRHFVHRRVWVQGSLPGRRSLRTHMIA
jgi:hypothetical protein